jgi:hypothetical protein
MIRRWIWIAFALIPLDAALAQQSPKTKLTIQVTDVTGASVPKAMIEVGGPTSHDATLAAEADGVGKSEFELPMGSYRLLVKSPGFCPFTKSLEVLQQQDQLITARLQVDTCPGPCAGPCVIPETEVQTTQSPFGHLSIRVADASGAAVPGARIQIHRSSDETGIDAATDSAGQVQVPLDAGIYELSISARGFQLWKEKEFEVAGETRRDVTLLIGNPYSGPVVAIQDFASFPIDHQPLTVEVASIPMAQLVLTPRPLRSKQRWF